MSTEPNSDSVSFRVAISRSGLFSAAVARHEGMLLKLARFRDIVAHRDLSEIRSGKAGNPWPLIYGSVFTFLKELEGEGLLRMVDIAGNNEETLRSLSINNTGDILERVQKRLQLHREKWEHLTLRERESAGKTPHPHIWPQQWDHEIDCPACGNKGYVRYETDFDIEDRRAVAAGAFAQYFSCLWCGLYVNDFEELQKLGIPISSYDFEGESLDSAVPSDSRAPT